MRENKLRMLDTKSIKSFVEFIGWVHFIIDNFVTLCTQRCNVTLAHGAIFSEHQ